MQSLDITMPRCHHFASFPEAEGLGIDREKGKRSHGPVIP